MQVPHTLPKEPPRSRSSDLSPRPVPYLAAAHKSQFLRAVDVLATVYLVGTGVLLLPGCTSTWMYPLCIGLHVVAIVGIVTLARARSLPLPLQAIRDLYPVLLLLILYGEVDLLVKLVHDPPGFDAMVQQWDHWLFGGHPHRYLAVWLSGPGWREVFHLFYLSYYLLVVGAFFAIWLRKPASLPRFAFVVTGMFVSFLAIFVAFPVAGPLSAPGVSLMTDGLFPSLVAQIYAPLTVNGIHSGAFPSSHVGMSVGIALLLAPRSWTSRIGLGLLVLGITASTVYGHFHYAIDAVAGLLAGGILYVVWDRLYTTLRPGQTQGGERTQTCRSLGSASTLVASGER